MQVHQPCQRSAPCFHAFRDPARAAFASYEGTGAGGAHYYGDGIKPCPVRGRYLVGDWRSKGVAPPPDVVSACVVETLGLHFKRADVALLGRCGGEPDARLID